MGTKTVKPKHSTREAWLEAAAVELTDLAKQLGGFGVPRVRVSVGFPKTRKKDVVGECFATLAASDAVSQIFVHPKVDDPVKVLGILMHELIHASDDGASGHKGEFIVRSKAVGMVKPWTACGVSDELRVALVAIADELGEWPHAALNTIDLGNNKKQTTRMIKAVCPSAEHEPEYIIRMSRKQMAEVGTPICPMHMLGMEAELPDDEPVNIEMDE